MLLSAVSCSKTINIQESHGLGDFGKMIILEFLVDIIPGFYMFFIKTAYSALHLISVPWFGEYAPKVMIHVGL